MQDIQLKLWRNDRQQDWSAEINGTRYDSVSLDVIESLVQYALLSADAGGSRPATPHCIH
jgi:hypothetical protein